MMKITSYEVTKLQGKNGIPPPPPPLTLPSFSLHAYSIHNLKVLVVLCDEWSRCFHIASIAMFWLFEEVTYGLNCLAHMVAFN